jgi:eukaryotic-like serine/threonine-protein kinase
VLGTAAYLSPEQARGEPAGPPADLYALGVVSYQLLAGRLPFDAASLTDLARQQDTTEPPPLHELDPAIPRALSRVVSRALERDPGERFADAASMERALAGALRGVAPPEPTAATRVVDETEATRALERTALTTPLARTQAAPPRRRRLEPIDEPAAAAPPRRQQARAAAAPPARRRSPRRAFRALRTLLILAVLAAIAVGAYMVVTESTERGVRLKEQIEGDVNQAVQEIQDLIDDNTR